MSKYQLPKIYLTSDEYALITQDVEDLPCVGLVIPNEGRTCYATTFVRASQPNTLHVIPFSQPSSWLSESYELVIDDDIKQNESTHPFTIDFDIDLTTKVDIITDNLTRKLHCKDQRASNRAQHAKLQMLEQIKTFLLN